jgi:serine/threonine-protein kinase HipA
VPRQLDVWLLSEHVGTLMQVDGRLGFVYRQEWLDRAPGDAGSLPQALSQSLPLRAEPFDDRATRPFFAGLLPEGEQRRLVAQALQASRQNDFALLEGIGGECAGAVTLLEPGQIPGHAAPSGLVESDPTRVRWLEGPALLKLLAEMPQRPMLAGQEGLRLSLAGAQDKLPVVVDRGDGAAAPLRIGLPLFGAPSTHILKPTIPGVEGSVHNEVFCMSLAGALKLPVAHTQILPVADQSVLLVQRYDRLADASGQATLRLHQEDFCQALGVPPEHKYQNEGGPDLAQCFALLRKATRPSAPNVLALLDAVVFNALVGNHDAHGKNFSLLYGQANAQLAPLYDLLCTAVYPQLTEKMAMKLGGKYRFTELMPRHWEQFARDAGLSPAQVKKRVLDIARRLPDLARTQLASFEGQGNSHPILNPIVTLIAQRCTLTTRRLTGNDTQYDSDATPTAEP